MRRIIPTLRVLLAVAILAILVGLVGLEGILARIAECSWPMALAGFAAALLAQCLGALRLKIFARSQQLPLTTMKALTINLSAMFYGLFLPGGNVTGWAVRLFHLAPSAKAFGTALLVLVGDRTVATAAGAGIGFIAGVLMSAAAMPAVTILLLATAAGMSVLGLTLFTRSLDSVLPLAERVPGVGWAAEYLRKKGTFDQRPAFSTVVTAIVLSAGVHFFGIVSWFVLARGLELDVDALTIVWVRSAAMVVALVPATIGGLGLREGAVVYLMAGLGVASVDALALSLLVFAVTVFWVGLVGGVLEAYGHLAQRSAARG
jgi:hypothetical protein